MLQCALSEMYGASGYRMRKVHGTENLIDFGSVMESARERKRDWLSEDVLAHV